MKRFLHRATAVAAFLVLPLLCAWNMPAAVPGFAPGGPPALVLDDQEGASPGDNSEGEAPGNGDGDPGTPDPGPGETPDGNPENPNPGEGNEFLPDEENPGEGDGEEGEGGGGDEGGEEGDGGGGGGDGGGGGGGAPPPEAAPAPTPTPVVTTTSAAPSSSSSSSSSSSRASSSRAGSSSSSSEASSEVVSSAPDSSAPQNALPLSTEAGPGGLVAENLFATRDHWALLNLILSLVTLAAALFMLSGIRRVLAKTDNILRISAGVVGVMSLALMLATGSASGAMYLVDGWTIVLGVLALAEGGLFIYIARHTGPVYKAPPLARGSDAHTVTYGEASYKVEKSAALAGGAKIQDDGPRITWAPAAKPKGKAALAEAEQAKRGGNGTQSPAAPPKEPEKAEAAQKAPGPATSPKAAAKPPVQSQAQGKPAQATKSGTAAPGPQPQRLGPIVTAEPKKPARTAGVPDTEELPELMGAASVPPKPSGRAKTGQQAKADSTKTPPGAAAKQNTTSPAQGSGVKAPGKPPATKQKAPARPPEGLATDKVTWEPQAKKQPAGKAGPPAAPAKGPGKKRGRKEKPVTWKPNPNES